MVVVVCLANVQHVLRAVAVDEDGGGVAGEEGLHAEEGGRDEGEEIALVIGLDRHDNVRDIFSQFNSSISY